MTHAGDFLVSATPRHLILGPLGLPLLEVSSAIIQVTWLCDGAAELVLTTTEVFLAC